MSSKLFLFSIKIAKQLEKSLRMKKRTHCRILCVKVFQYIFLIFFNFANAPTQISPHLYIILRSDIIFKISQIAEITDRVPRTLTVSSNFLRLGNHSLWLAEVFHVTDWMLRVILSYDYNQTLHFFKYGKTGVYCVIVDAFCCQNSFSNSRVYCLQNWSLRYFKYSIRTGC